MNGRVVIVGGGITGLTTAYRLMKMPEPPEITVVEASDSLGGKLISVEVGGLELEGGPDSLLTRKPWGIELCLELGLADQLVPSAVGKTHILTEKGLIAFPSGPLGIPTNPMELLKWPGMSMSGKLKAVWDLWSTKSGLGDDGSGDEAIGALIRRHLGNEACDRLVAPLLGGLFAGDVDRLSVRATFPELQRWEQKHGSLMRGARAQANSTANAKPVPMFVRLRGGFSSLVKALIAELSAGGVQLLTNVRAKSIQPHVSGGYTLLAEPGGLRAEEIVLTCPAPVSAQLLDGLAPVSEAELRKIPYISTALAALVYPQGTADLLPVSSGFVTQRDTAPMTAATFLSRKWPDPSFEDRAVVRCFVGATGTEYRAGLPDDVILADVQRSLSDLLGLPPQAEATAVTRWPKATPQYEVGHLERVAAIEAGMPPGIQVCGQALAGAGIPDCVRAAGRAAEAVASRLT